MGAHTAVADVTRALRAATARRVTDTVDSLTDAAVAAVSPAAVAADDPVRLGIWLYGIDEHATRGNDDRTRVDETRYREPPVGLSLRYLLTAYPGGGTPTTRSLDQQRVLGAGVQALDATGTLDGGRLPADDPAPQITLESRSPEALSRLWRTVPDAPRQPSVAYRVGPVLIDSPVESVIPPVDERATDLTNTE
jgi:hypothetical protein